MDNVFLAIYIMELILKLYALGSHFFNSGWNVMGMLSLITLSVLVKIVKLIKRTVIYFNMQKISNSDIMTMRMKSYI
jgi:hypothetical protein